MFSTSVFLAYGAIFLFVAYRLWITEPCDDKVKWLQQALNLVEAEKPDDRTEEPENRMKLPGEREGKWEDPKWVKKEWRKMETKRKIKHVMFWTKSAKRYRKSMAEYTQKYLKDDEIWS